VTPREVVDETAFASYDTFAGTLPPPLEATRQQLVDGLRAIVAAEGPVLGERLHVVYVRAAGGLRVGKLIAKTLNSAITAAVRQGVLLADDPLGESGVKPRTYRLPDQPVVRVRQLGMRPFEHVPPRELASVIARVADELGWDNEEAVYRATLEKFGLKRLTANVHERFRAMLPLAKSQ
jgi:hypothetical protein